MALGVAMENCPNYGEQGGKEGILNKNYDADCPC